MPERSKGYDLSSYGESLVGSKPTATINILLFTNLKPYIYGSMPERSKGCDSSSHGVSLVGSKPTATINILLLLILNHILLITNKRCLKVVTQFI